MRLLTIGLLCGALLMSGCSRQQVNEVSVFEYEAGDEVPMMVLKTSGNVIPWVVGFVVLAIAAAPEAAIQALAATAASTSKK